MKKLQSYQQLAIAELHRRLEKEVQAYQRSERLICLYLLQIKRRRGYEDFGFANVEDYALELLGFSPSKIRQLLALGRKLLALPKVTEALARGDIGWTKASKVAMVATAKDEKEWLDKAVSLSTRQLERHIRDQLQPGGSNVNWWLTGEQTAVVARAMEICRRMAGEEIDPGRCLDLICGEFLATYEYMAEQDVEIVEASATEGAPSACPEGDELPPPVPVRFTKAQLEVLKRDEYRCQYPGCSVMCGLHPHHIVFRSHTGKKSRAESDSPSNVLTLCFVHHRMLHAGNIWVSGKAPDELEWRRPELMESSVERFNELAAEAFEPDDFELPGQEQGEAAAPAGAA